MNVPKISWHQLGKLTEPGRYQLLFGWVTVTSEDMAIWALLPRDNQGETRALTQIVALYSLPGRDICAVRNHKRDWHRV
jgi:hypothetical protein